MTPPSTVGLSDYFGCDVSIGNGKLAVGARQDEASGQPTNSGIVVLYDLDGSNPTVFTSGDESSTDQFGYAVALSGSRLYATAPYDDDGAGTSLVAIRERYIFLIQQVVLAYFCLGCQTC